MGKGGCGINVYTTAMLWEQRACADCSSSSGVEKAVWLAAALFSLSEPAGYISSSDITELQGTLWFLKLYFTCI